MESNELLALQELKARLSEQETKNAVLQKASTLFNSNEESGNMVMWRLDPDKELARIERLLRKQVPKRDSQGISYYAEPKKEDQLFNEYGINEIMNVLSSYINKSITLSNYTDDEVNLIMKNFATEIVDFIFINAEKFGLDTPEKKKHFPMVVKIIVDLVDATYHRAIGGLEREGLNKVTMVSQTENLGQPLLSSMPKRKLNILKPSTWV
jgi:hypothetical protein